MRGWRSLALHGVAGARRRAGAGGRCAPAARFWVLLRAAQALAVALAALAGRAAARGHEPDDGLFWLYALVPVAVGFVAEQLRIVVGADGPRRRATSPTRRRSARCRRAEQRSVVLAIVRREMGVMALAMRALVLPGAACARHRGRALTRAGCARGYACFFALRSPLRGDLRATQVARRRPSVAAGDGREIGEAAARRLGRRRDDDLFAARRRFLLDDQGAVLAEVSWLAIVQTSR